LVQRPDWGFVELLVLLFLKSVLKMLRRLCLLLSRRGMGPNLYVIDSAGCLVQEWLLGYSVVADSFIRHHTLILDRRGGC